MGTVIKKTANNHGTFRYLRDVDVANYPSADWLHNPNVSSLINIPEQYWKVSGSSVIEMNTAEKLAVDADKADIMNQTIAGTLGFEKSGTCKNKWLGFGSSKSSDKIPYIITSPMTITGITFINEKNGCDTDIRVYRNDELIYTWEVRNKRWAWKTSDLHTLSFSPGDKLGIYLKDRGEDAKHVIVTINYTAWSHEVGEGGSSTL